MNRVEVLKPGPQTTVQDSGRPGLLAKGISPGGAHDAFALRVANALVGNAAGPPPLSLGEPGAAGLELLMQGPSLRFEQAAVIAVTGAEMVVKVDGEPVEQWRAVRVPAGGRVDVGPARSGMRGYLAIAGGIDLPPYLGSRSTHLLGGLGGLDGRALTKGDLLPLGAPATDLAALVGRVFDTAVLTPTASPHTIRVTRGPQDELFEEASLETFFSARWRLSPQSNRMGARLSGPPLAFVPRPAYLERDAGANASNVVDDPIPLGGIQAPDGAALIVMGVEHPTAGGYAKPATVITADVGRVGQVRPGEEVVFAEVTVEQALAAAQELEELLERGLRGLT